MNIKNITLTLIMLLNFEFSVVAHSNPLEQAAHALKKLPEEEQHAVKEFYKLPKDTGTLLAAFIQQDLETHNHGETLTFFHIIQNPESAAAPQMIPFARAKLEEQAKHQEKIIQYFGNLQTTQELLFSFMQQRLKLLEKSEDTTEIEEQISKIKEKMLNPIHMRQFTGEDSNIWHKIKEQFFGYTKNNKVTTQTLPSPASRPELKIIINIDGGRTHFRGTNAVCTRSKPTQTIIETAEKMRKETPEHPIVIQTEDNDLLQSCLSKGIIEHSSEHGLDAYFELTVNPIILMHLYEAFKNLPASFSPPFLPEELKEVIAQQARDKEKEDITQE